VLRNDRELAPPEPDSVTRQPATASSGPRALLAAGNAAVARLVNGGLVQRCGPVPCDCDEEEQLDHALHRHASHDHAPAAPPAQFIDAVGSSQSGHPLPEGFRAEAENRFGASFEDVRLHTDTSAGDAAEIVSAHAFTVGNHVFFGPGQYRPDDKAGQRLLAHELTHVVQGGAPRPASRWVSRPHDPAELAAENAADRFMSGGPVGAPAAAPSAVSREGPAAPDTSASQAIIDAVKADNVAEVVKLLSGRQPPELVALRGVVKPAIGSKLESWLLRKIRGGEAVASIQRGLSIVGGLVTGGAVGGAASALLGGKSGGGGQAEQGIRALWPALTLIEKLQLYDEGWRELEQAQLDVIRAASPADRAAARGDKATLDRIYGLMDPKEEFEARCLINPTADGKFEAAQKLLGRAHGILSDEEDAVFDAFLDLTPPLRKRLYNENLKQTAEIFTDERRTLLRNLAYGSEAQALIARLKEATEGRSDDMAAVQKVVDKAVALLQERAALKAQAASGTLPSKEKQTVDDRLKELEDLDQLLTFTRGKDGKLEQSSFLGMLSAARGDAGAFSADAQKLGQFATGDKAAQHAFETAKERILLSGGNVDAIRSAIIGLQAARTAAPTAGGPTAAEHDADKQLRQKLLDDPAVAAVLNSLSGFDKMLVTGAVDAGPYEEAKSKLTDAFRAADWGAFFRQVLTIARNPEWTAKFKKGGESAADVYAQVQGEQRSIMEKILETKKVPVDAVLLFTGDADILAAAFGDLKDDERARLRLGYMLSIHPPAGTPSEPQTTALNEFKGFDGKLKQRWHWYRAPLDPADYQKVLWAALGSEPTDDELSTKEGRFRAAELMYQQQQGKLGLDKGVAADFTEADETMAAAAREFAARFEPLRPKGELSTLDLEALSALHDRFLHRKEEFTEASNTISEMAGVVAATVAGIVVVAATGGAATPAVIAMAAAAGAGSRVVTQEMFGADYNDPNARQALLGAVDGALAVVSGSLAAKGAQLMGVGGQALVKGAARAAGEIAAEASETAVKAAPSMARRVAASSVESALDGAFSGAVSEAFGKLSDPATWRRGVWAGLVKAGQAVLLAGLSGLGSGALLGAAMPVLGAGASKVWDAVMGQSIEKKLAAAGLTGKLAEARAAAQAGDVSKVNSLVGDIESHLTPAEANALRDQLNAELKAKLGHPPGTAEPANPKQKLLLQEAGEIIDGTQLSKEMLEAEFDVVKRSEPQISTVDGYVDQVDLGNGHTWRRKEDLTWCRFSVPTRCGERIPGVHAPTEEALNHIRSLTYQLENVRGGIDRHLVESLDLQQVRDKLVKLGPTGQGRLNIEGLTERERAILREAFDMDDAELRQLTNAQLQEKARELGTARKGLEAREAILVDQIRDEGTPLYDRLRRRSPRGEGKATAIKRSHSKGMVDEISLAKPPSGDLDCDHVYPLVRMVQEKGFVELPLPIQVSIANDAEVLMMVDSSLNRSRGERLWSENWPRRGEYNAEALARAVAAEERAIAHVRKRIAEELAKAPK
jgi:hypothetical protein